ncbi:thioredoxin family protein [Cupriavidus basilensis]|uniref:Thioredoxin family protein n=1 Tax=Cupriavidus basilensis TaxID=68895 RepID=A0A643FTR7_9BURK|nr:thioredoxin family protein [Cupriavidus basilensis]QOT75989.1 thioredoxin family protein [Cupriavidus basilensis]
MTMTDVYGLREPARTEIDAIKGPAVIEFGAPWCGYCMRAQPHLANAMASYPEVAHIKVEDGSGKPLGRSFRIKLWPTLVFMRDGVEVARLVRPSETRAIEEALRRIAG